MQLQWRNFMQNMEIEKKYLIQNPPFEITSYPFHRIEQAYLCTSPVIRIRRQDAEYYLTYKGSGLMAHEEYNLPLTKESYSHLLAKADGNIISKKRYLIPIENSTLTIELDVFEGVFSPLVMAEVEFSSLEEAASFTPPEWFGEDVTMNTNYHNSTMSRVIK